jgi:ribosomal protein S18 acetylase RimI-like enzyme
MTAEVWSTHSNSESAAITVRRIEREDVDACALVAYRAHEAVAAAHTFPQEHPTIEFSIGLIGSKLNDPHAWGILAEQDGRVLGSVFLNAFPSTPVAVIGPLTVDPATQGGIGRRLMRAAMDEAHRREIRQVRLVQSPSHLRSLALYVKSGFDAREPLVLMSGTPSTSLANEGGAVRPARADDMPSCNALCTRTHGFARSFELHNALAQGTASVVERAGAITGYATAIGLRGHAIGEADGDLLALIAAATTAAGPGFLVPVRNGSLLRRLLEDGYRSLWPALLMTAGPYQEPAGPFLPSIAF